MFQNIMTFRRWFLQKRPQIAMKRVFFHQESCHNYGYETTLHELHFEKLPHPTYLPISRQDSRELVLFSMKKSSHVFSDTRIPFKTKNSDETWLGSQSLVRNDSPHCYAISKLSVVHLKMSGNIEVLIYGFGWIFIKVTLVILQYHLIASYTGTENNFLRDSRLAPS